MSLVRVLLAVCVSSFLLGWFLLQYPQTRKGKLPRILGYIASASLFTLVVVQLWRMYAGTF
jgi:hypothetical protein